jgi:hypothetical protein
MEVAGVNDRQTESFYTGDLGTSRYLFPVDTWIDFQKHLTTSEVIMRMICCRRGFKFLSNIYGDWPARRLRRRKLFGYLELRLSLNPKYTDDNNVFFELSEHRVRDVLGFFQKSLKYHPIVRYSVEQMNNRHSLARDIESAISNWS